MLSVLQAKRAKSTLYFSPVEKAVLIQNKMIKIFLSDTRPFEIKTAGVSPPPWMMNVSKVVSCAVLKKTSDIAGYLSFTR